MSQNTPITLGAVPNPETIFALSALSLFRNNKDSGIIKRIVARALYQYAGHNFTVVGHADNNCIYACDLGGLKLLTTTVPIHAESAERMYNYLQGVTSKPRVFGFIIDDVFIGLIGDKQGLLMCMQARVNTDSTVITGILLDVQPLTQGNWAAACGRLPRSLVVDTFNDCVPIRSKSNDGGSVFIISENMTVCRVSRASFIRCCRYELTGETIHPAPSMTSQVAHFMSELINDGGLLLRPDLDKNEVEQVIALTHFLKYDYTG